MGYYAGKREGIPSDLMGILTQAAAGTKSTATKTLGVTTQAGQGTAAAQASGKIYCCKKCDEATKTVKRYSSPTPCAAPAVACTAADPVCTGGEDPGTCASNCQKQYPGAANQIALMRCLAACKGPGKTCTKDADCPAGETCVDGVCKKTVVPGVTCPPGVQVWGAKDANCPCGKKFKKPSWTVEAGPTATDCPAGYKPDGWLCRCNDQTNYCTDDSQCDGGRKCVNGQCAGGDGGGEFDWSGDLTDFWKMLMTKGKGLLTDYAYPEDLQTLLTGLTARGQEFLGRKPGFSDTMMTNILGSNLDKIRGAGTASRQNLLSDLQSEGMLGTGAGMGLINKGSWNTEGNVANTLRDLALANEAQKRSDLESFTGLASGLAGQRLGAEQGLQSINLQRGGLANQMFGSGMTFEQLKEAINAARRGEGSNSMALLMQYLLGLMSGYK